MADEISAGVADRVAQVYQDVADVERRADDARRAGDRIQSIRESYESDDGVWVEVDSVGRLTDIRFAEKASRLSGEDLADAVLHAMYEARRAAGARAMDVATEGFGINDAMLDRLRTVYVPAPPPDREPPEPPVQRYSGPLIFG